MDPAQAAQQVALVVASLAPIVNPVAAAPLFLSLTRNAPEGFRRQQAARAALYSMAILSGFLLLGNAIIDAFGISLPGIRVAGGLIVLVLAFRMLFSGDAEADTVRGGAEDIRRAQVDVSFTPLAMPTLAGPGSIALVMTLGADIPSGQQLAGHLVVLLGVAITCLLSWATLLSAGWLSRFLGDHGIQAITKIMGFLLACIAVQFIFSGVEGFMRAMA